MEELKKQLEPLAAELEKVPEDSREMVAIMAEAFVAGVNAAAKLPRPERPTA